MLLIKSIKKMKKSYNVISVMLSRLAIVCKRVLAKCGFNCFKAAEHRGDSREEINIIWGVNVFEEISEIFYSGVGASPTSISKS